MSERRPRKTVPLSSIPPSAQQWVSQGKERAPKRGRTKRLTLDIPEDMHMALKLKTVREGTTMLEVIELLIEHYLREETPREPQ